MKSKEIMIQQLPYYERDNEIINEIYRVLGDEADGLLYKINDLYKQLNVDTATWGLDIWESNVDLSISNSLSYEERRAIIKTKLKSLGKVSTKTLESAIQDYYKGKVNVYFNHKLLFEIPMEGLSAQYLDYTIHIINELKPSHLGYDIQLYLQPIETNFHLGAFHLSGEEIVVYPSVAMDPYVEPRLFIGAYYNGLAESVVIGSSENSKINTQLNTKTVGNIVNQLEQIVIKSRG